MSNSLAADLSSKWILVSEPVPHVLHVELSRKPVNAFAVEFWKAYAALLDRITQERRDVRALVLSSALPKLFTAGIDLADAALMNTGGLSGGSPPDAARASLSTFWDITAFQHAVAAPLRCPFPVIAAVHGMTLGVGVDMITACDIRYAAEGSQFSIKEVDIGLAADVGTLAYLPKSTGNSSLMHEVAYSARMFSTQEAEKLGLVSKVVPGGRAEVVAAALDLASLIAQKSPIAVSGTKRILLHSRDHTVAENLEYTAAWNSAALQTQDITEGLKASKARRVGEYAPLLRTKL